MPTTTIHRHDKELEGAADATYETVQYMTTIPKALAEAREIENGQQVEWKITDDNNLLMVLDDD